MGSNNLAVDSISTMANRAVVSSYCPPVKPHAHSVQFYEDDSVLLEGVSQKIGSALGAGGVGIVIATGAHRDALAQRLAAWGVNVDVATSTGRYVTLDAAETLASFMVNGWPDEDRFSTLIGGAIVQATIATKQKHPQVAAFGEMVALLWAEGETDAAIRLEQLWNNLSQRHTFSLHCAYPMAGFANDGHGDQLRMVCAEHSQVIPVESFTSLRDEDERLRAITLLQQKAKRLETVAAEREALARDLAAELTDLRELHLLSTRLNHVNLPQIMQDVVSAVAKLQNTDMGLLSLLDAGGNDLRVGSSLGFSSGFLKCVERVPAGSGACGTCLATRARVIIEDTENDPGFAAYRAAARSAGFRAVHSTPLIDQTGNLVGVLSVHFRSAYRPTEREIRLTDLYARLAVSAIENARLFHEAQEEIARRRTAEEALRKSEEFARSIVESSVDSIQVLDIDGRIVYTGPRGPLSFRADSTEASNSPWIELWMTDEQPRAAKAITMAQTGGSARFQGHLSLANAATKVLDVSLAPIFDATARTERVIAITRDITELKAAQSALLEAEKLAATGRLAATIAHEINNPLEAVTNFIYLAKTSDGISEEVRGQLDIADQELSRITHIAQQTLGFYRDNSQPRWIDLQETIDSVLTIYERKMQYSRLTVIREIDPEVKVHIRQGELKQALSNLIANAIDAGRDGGQIWVRVRRSSDWTHPGGSGVQIIVADNGAGIGAEMKSRIFTPFFTTKAEVGTGIGLWVTKSLIEKQGGSIRFRSRQGDRSGTVMSIFLPVIASTTLSASGDCE